MAENSGSGGDFFDFMAESFWATLPEDAAANLAKCKTDSLSWIRDAVTSVINDEIKRTEEHLRNAQKMREAHCKSESPAADGPQPAA